MSRDAERELRATTKRARQLLADEFGLPEPNTGNSHHWPAGASGDAYDRLVAPLEDAADAARLERELFVIVAVPELATLLKRAKEAKARRWEQFVGGAATAKRPRRGLVAVGLVKRHLAEAWWDSRLALTRLYFWQAWRPFTARTLPG